MVMDPTTDTPLTAAKEAETSPVEPLRDYQHDSPLYVSGVHLQHTVTVLKPASELYREWRDLTGLRRFAPIIEEIRIIDEGRSHWRIRGPMDDAIEWDAVLVEDVPERLIRWRSLEHVDVPQAGSISFTPAPIIQGTEVTVRFTYNPPVGRWTASLLQHTRYDPQRQLRESLRRFKQWMETGEIPVASRPPS